MKAPGQSLAPSWVSDLQSPPPARSKSTNIVDPPLYPSQALTSSKRHKEPKLAPREQPTPEQMDALKLKKAWEVSLAPVKGLPMTAIMMYMSGNSLQIFSIMMVVMAFKNPLVGLLNTNQALDRFATERNSGSILQVKLVYVVCQLVALAVGIWKVNSMGLLPTTRSDWLMWEAARTPLQTAIPAL
ncbi:ER membrane protein complex subunit 4 [Ceratocystis fimbriata CBS 114723]|uniref:ER membrane protein complex subunit 4 n=1 Tax=Ceratocystis fimbriata CBS 114723 TaxID=1035309 RepID=A0A2C5XDY9_9PEZI|nr:ER membrane protein complex subunit 4 [Ceratocystis fimbriata CBS 114723]